MTNMTNVLGTGTVFSIYYISFRWAHPSSLRRAVADRIDMDKVVEWNKEGTVALCNQRSDDSTGNMPNTQYDFHQKTGFQRWIWSYCATAAWREGLECSRRPFSTTLRITCRWNCELPCHTMTRRTWTSLKTSSGLCWVTTTSVNLYSCCWSNQYGWKVEGETSESSQGEVGALIVSILTNGYIRRAYPDQIE